MVQKEEVVKKIIMRISEIFGKKESELSEATRFVEDLGAKSGNASQLTNFMEDEFDVEIPFMEFRRRATIGEAADYILSLIED